MNAPQRRGACPGLSDPMPTGDGLLARLTPAGGTIAPDVLAALCAAARRHGNGILEITQRGSVQIRGLKPASAAIFADTVAALKIGATQTIPVVAGPLSGLDPDELFDAGELAGELRNAIVRAPNLSALHPKISVAIDGGGALHLDALSADLRLCARKGPSGACLHVAAGGDGLNALPIGAVAVNHAVDAVRRLLETIAAQGPLARARDMIRAAGIAPFRTAVADRLIAVAPPPPSRPPAEPIGVHRLRNGRVVLGIALAFGHVRAAALENLIAAAVDAGASGFRAAPGHALLIVGLVPEKIESLIAAAQSLDFIVRPDDPRRRIAACPGAPYCSSGLIAARSLAQDIARRLAPSREGIAIHLSGCAKGCAHPAPCALTIVGSENGCGIVRDGSARDDPHYHVDAVNLAREVVKIAAGIREAVDG